MNMLVLANQLSALNTLGGVLSFIIFAALGVLALVGGYKLFDRLTPGDLHGEVFKGNTAVAVLAAGFLVALAVVLGAAIAG